MGGEMPRWMASIVALMIGAMAATIVHFVATSHPALTASRTISGSIGQLNDAFGQGLIGSVITVPLAIVFGYPLHLALYRMGARNLVAYCVGGAIAGCVGALVLTHALRLAPAHPWQNVLPSLGLGALAASLAWLLRRPDRDVREEDRAPPGAQRSERPDVGV
jgi:MFS family permease